MGKTLLCQKTQVNLYSTCSLSTDYLKLVKTENVHASIAIPRSERTLPDVWNIGSKLAMKDILCSDKVSTENEKAFSVTATALDQSLYEERPRFWRETF